MTKAEEKAKAYDEALEQAKKELAQSGPDSESARQIKRFFPELRESEDERIIRAIIDALYSHTNSINLLSSRGYQMEDIEAWLEKQKERWTPSKEIMDTLYALAYLTNTVDDRKDEVITKLYQDLKREFFNGASYENMFPMEEKQKEQKPAEWSEEDKKMKQEEKQLLLITLCSTLPYETFVQYEGKEWLVTGYGHGRVGLLPSLVSSAVGPCPLVEEVKPYLRPMSSMTEGEHLQAIELNFIDLVGYIDWLNAHHFDYRGLIEKGLAIDCTNLNIY